MPVRRTYACDQCAHQWTETTAKSDDPYPDCPGCGGASGWVPKGFAITTTKSKAMDIAQSAMEDMGHSDFRDNQRAGDIAAKGPAPMQTAEAEAITRSMIEHAKLEGDQANSIAPELMSQAQNFWGGGVPNMGQMTADPVRGVAAEASTAARDLGADPIALLHEAGQRGELNLLSPERLNVVSRAKGA